MEGSDAVTSATDVMELDTIEECGAVTSAIETGVTDATVIKGQQVIEHDVITGSKTQNEDKDFDLQCKDLLSKLIDHYLNSVICVPLSTVNPSSPKGRQEIPANPKIHKMKIEKDGKHVKQEQIYNYKDCFCRGFKRIYLQGEPCSGKSYFAVKLVHDWCNVQSLIVKSTKEKMMFGDVDTLKKFSFLFFISLRDSSEQTHVTQMIKTQLIYKIYAEDKWESAYKLVLKIMKNVMFLIIQDGLDDWPCKEALPSIDEIPNGNCTVFTTSRPWKLADERIINSQIDILFNLEGISDSKEFSEKILQCHFNEPNDIKKWVNLFEEFISSRNLKSILCSPMLFALVLCVWVDHGVARLTGSSLYTTHLDNDENDDEEDDDAAAAADDDVMAERLTGSSLCEQYTTQLENLCKRANKQTSCFDKNHRSPVNCFSRTRYVKPNIKHIDAISKVAFSFWFFNEKESSLVFSDLDLKAHLSETEYQFALDSGLLSKRKGKGYTDKTMSFVHKTTQEFLAAFHIHMHAGVIDDVIHGYLIRHDNSYRDIYQMFIFLCGFNISAANKLSRLMNELDVHRDSHYYFQDCIISGYKEAIANKNAPIHLHLSHFDFNSDNAENLIQIWTLNTAQARSLRVDWKRSAGQVTIRSQDASSADCHGPGPVVLPGREDRRPSTLNDEEGIRSSRSFIEFDLSLCHSLERLELRGRDVKLLELRGRKVERLEIDGRHDLSGFGNAITVQPHALAGLKKLKYLNLTGDCKCEALDLSHFEHIESIEIDDGVTLLPLSIDNYKTLQCIRLLTAYDGLDLSLFDNLKSITIMLNKVNMLPKPLLIHNKINHISLHDFESVNYKTWCLLNGADPKTYADNTPVLYSIQNIRLYYAICSSTWLRSLVRTLLTIDHKVECELWYCTITSGDHEEKEDEDSDMSSCKEDEDSDMSSCKEDEFSESSSSPYTIATITTDINNTCTFEVLHDCPGLWETLHGQNAKCLSITGNMSGYDSKGLKMGHVLSQELASLSQLETLTMHLSVYIDVQLPPSLKHLTVYYNKLHRENLLHLMTKLSVFTQSILCILEFGCNNKVKGKSILPEIYIPNQQELEALKHVEVKRFRIYDRNTHIRSDDAWSVRNSDVDDGDNNDDIGEDELCKKYLKGIDDDDGVFNRISMRLQIN